MLDMGKNRIEKKLTHVKSKRPAMVRAIEDVTSTANLHRAAEVPSVDERVAEILTYIQKEKVPSRLLEHATELQQVLALRRQLDRPN
jgi:hypothetical protein